MALIIISLVMAAAKIGWTAYSNEKNKSTQEALLRKKQAIEKKQVQSARVASAQNTLDTISASAYANSVARQKIFTEQRDGNLKLQREVKENQLRENLIERGEYHLGKTV